MLYICTHSLVGNLSLWSIIQTLVDFRNRVQNGYNEKGMKPKSCEFYNIFRSIITFYKFSVTEYYGVFGQKMIIAVNVSGLYSNCEKDTKKLNLYLKNGWNFKRVDTDGSGTMFYMLEKQ